jgi:plasmid stabilization system protein ParE
VKLRVDPAALEELLEAEEYVLQEFGVTVANEFRLTAAAALEEITHFPKRYTKKQKNIRKRVLWPYPYSIVYEEMEDTVRVYAFAHDKREPGYWRKRV